MYFFVQTNIYLFESFISIYEELKGKILQGKGIRMVGWGGGGT